MWNFKKEYKDKKIFVRGYGQIDFKTESPKTIHKFSLLKGTKHLIKYIEKNGKESKKTTANG